MFKKRPSHSAWILNEFRVIWYSQAIATIGIAIHNIALPIIAIHFLHASVIEISLISTARYLPNLLFSIGIGSFVDRADTKRVAIYAELTRFILVLSIPVLYFFYTINIQFIIAIAFLIGIARIFFELSMSSLFPIIIPSDKRLSANSNLEVISSVGEISGPGIGGFIISIIGAIFSLLINALTFFISALFITQLKVQDKDKKNLTSLPKYSFFDGFRELASRPTLMGIVLVSAISNLGFMAVQSVYFVVTLNLFGFNTLIASTLLIFSGIGSLLGNLLARWLCQFFSVKFLMLCSITIMVMGSIIMILATGPIWITAIFISLGYFLWGLCLGLFNIYSTTYRQSVVPPETMGKIVGTARTLIYGTMPLGALAGGFIVEFLGSRQVFIFNCLINLISLMILFFSLRKSEDIIF
ncbi:MFS transporter [Acinetobacter boissieri]|uniref:Predicted arabinose efflux permease, MFS family n=1 Tax=Acinetobacter boissieri TaxID=1219383 RepID=A0A1G6GV62_9GAMM|nr:MFS transporter [Acinetobacter boissieri]SDB85585.1 Predicted arabinose efflux permease, MFS family [Acinetobacter boissieri]